MLFQWLSLQTKSYGTPNQIKPFPRCFSTTLSPFGIFKVKALIGGEESIADYRTTWELCTHPNNLLETLLTYMYLPSIVNVGLLITMGWELGIQYDPQKFLM